MAGNVYEWCNDWMECDLGEAAEEDPVGEEIGTLRVLRGGSWLHVGDYLRCAHRGHQAPENSIGRFGFRVARTAGS